MAADEIDQHWMERALAQAERSVALASPNPAVGCVLVQADRVVGEGFHQYDQRDHAEIVALRQAGSEARGATAYVTLEPCNHQGRTGPCTSALLAAGVKRVVVATVDPNPVVRGQGVSRLRAAGVEVRAGVLEQPARQLNDSFARFITTATPFVTMKVASSLDGRIAPAHAGTGAPHWITGEASRAHVHRMRHAADGLIVGVGTIVADNPLLTDRSGLPRRRPLLRIVLDSTLRTPLASQLVSTAQQDVLFFFSHATPERQQAFEARGLRLQHIPQAPSQSGLPLAEVMSLLGKMQITSLLLEGGAELYTAALNERVVDKLMLFYAPKFLGHEAIPMLGSINQPPTLQRCELRKFGEDFAVEAYLRDPWATVASQ